MFAQPVNVLRVDTDRPLGAVLDAAAASCALLAKMDDDDVYGPEHLWDLVLAVAAPPCRCGAHRGCPARRRQRVPHAWRRLRDGAPRRPPHLAKRRCRVPRHGRGGTARLAARDRGNRGPAAPCRLVLTGLPANPVILRKPVLTNNCWPVSDFPVDVSVLHRWYASARPHIRNVISKCVASASASC